LIEYRAHLMQRRAHFIEYRALLIDCKALSIAYRAVLCRIWASFDPNIEPVW